MKNGEIVIRRGEMADIPWLKPIERAAQQPIHQRVGRELAFVEVRHHLAADQATRFHLGTQLLAGRNAH